MAHRGYMRERSPGRWQLIVSDGFQASGKRRQHRKTVFGSSKQAATALAKYITEIESGTLANCGNITLAEFFDLWLADYAQPRIAATTYRRYKADVERFVKPTLGQVRLAKLTAGDLQSAYAKWQRERHDGRKGGLSAQTVVHVHRILHHALQTALRQGALTRNVADAASPPKPVHREMPVLDHDQVSKLLNTAKATRIELPVTLGLACGLRRSELLGLRWRDVSFERATLTVAQALEHTAEFGLRFKSPKSGKARLVALPAIGIEALHRHRARQNEIRLMMGSAYNTKFDLVLATESGLPMNPDRLASSFRYALKKAGLPDAGLHVLRHTFATLGLSNGANPLIISQALGHQSPAFTLKQYGHSLPSMQAEAASAMDGVLRSALNGKKGA